MYVTDRPWAGLLNQRDPSPDEGKRPPLSLGGVDDAYNGQNYAYQAQQAANDTDDEAHNRDPAQHRGYHADDRFQQEEDQSLIGVETYIRVILFHKQSQQAQNGEIIENTDDFGGIVRLLIRGIGWLLGRIGLLLVRLLVGLLL